MKRLMLVLLLILIPLAHGQVPQPAPAFDPVALDAYATKSLAECKCIVRRFAYGVFFDH